MICVQFDVMMWCCDVSIFQFHHLLIYLWIFHFLTLSHLRRGRCHCWNFSQWCVQKRPWQILLRFFFFVALFERYLYFNDQKMEKRKFNIVCSVHERWRFNCGKEENETCLNKVNAHSIFFYWHDMLQVLESLVFTLFRLREYK